MLVYTFRTYPYIEELKVVFSEVFIFSNLNEDFEIFKKLLENHHSVILGIANVKGQSRIEPKAVNNFNQGRLEKDGPEQVELYLEPKLRSIKVANKPTTTFCNWTMYKIQRYIELEQLGINFSFVHINANDLDKLNQLKNESLQQNPAY